MWTTGDKINAGLLLLAVVAIFMTWWQARASAKTQRATFLRDLYATLNNDDGIRVAYYMIEYGKFNYDKDFHQSEQEHNMDRLLSFVDLVCELYLRGVLTHREIQFFEYRFRRIAMDTEVGKYLEFLGQFYVANHATSIPFPSFSRYAGFLTNTTPLRLIDRVRFKLLP